MKEYKFEYIKEIVDKWHKEVPKNVKTIEETPYGIMLPFADIDENGTLIVIPARDYYGEPIEDIVDWFNQRHEYCIKLAKEYEN